MFSAFYKLDDKFYCINFTEMHMKVSQHSTSDGASY